MARPRTQIVTMPAEIGLGLMKAQATKTTIRTTSDQKVFFIVVSLGLK
jgi:hypothetical protein